MSKIEHDAEAARDRTGQSSFDKPWYRSSSETLSRNNLVGLDCLDLCCGNGEFSQILRDHHRMEVTCADYIPYHLQNVEKQGFVTFQVDIDEDFDQVNQVAAEHEANFDLVVSLAAIEHVFDSDNLLRFAHTALRADGHLLVNTPNIAFMAYRLYPIFSGNRPFGEGHHIRFWDFRFLRTNLFLNGFSVVDDGRQFYSLPQDAMLRAFRNRKRVAAACAWLFHGCRFLQHIPFFRGVCSDELTVLARKDDVPPVGFELNKVKRFLDENPAGSPERRGAVERLKLARSRGWLNEHLYLGKLVDEL